MTTPRSHRTTFSFAVGLGALLVSALAHGADASPLGQSFWMNVSAYHSRIDTDVRVDHPATGASGTSFSFEELGLASKKTLPSLQLGVRFGTHWRAELEVLRLRRSGRASLTRDVSFDDVTYPVQAALATTFQSEFIRAGIGYSFVHRPTAEFGVAAGLHVARFDMALEGSVAAAGQSLNSRRTQEEATVPLPTFGLFGSLAFAPKWVGQARADVFSLRHRGYDGRLVNAQASVLYRVTPNVGVGLGYRVDDYSLKASKNDWQGRVDYRIRGPLVFVEAGF